MRRTNFRQMATYNKRGFKAPKPKEDPTDDQLSENINVDEKDSTTAGVFNSLDATVNKSEAWIERNQKAIYGVIAAVALGAIGYVLYQNFVAEPKEDEAADAMFVAQQNFELAINGMKADSLFTLALNGSEGQFGFVDIANEYSGTDAGNLANYYAGIAYLNTGKFDEAIASLGKFKSKDQVLSVLAVGAKADAHAQKKEHKEALDLYVKAAKMQDNTFTAPMYLLKAGKMALVLNNKTDAAKYFTEIKDKYDSSPEAQEIDALIGLAQ